MSPASRAAPQRFPVALLQMAVAADPRENLEKGLSMIREAAKRGARVVCLPELFRTRYFCQREDTAFFDLAEIGRAHV